MTRIALAVAALVGAAAPATAADVSFSKDVKPFLQKYCVECHTGPKGKAGYNLDTMAGLLAPAKKGAAVVPGKPEKSLLLLTMTGGAKAMPPKKSTVRPTKDEIAAIKDWITAGAKDDSAGK